MDWDKIPIFLTFLGEFGSQDYEKHIVDLCHIFDVCTEISRERYELQNSNRLCRSALERTGHTKNFRCRSVRLFVRLSVNRRKTISEDTVLTVSSKRYAILQQVKFQKPLMSFQ